MVKINDNYCKLSESYLFSEIDGCAQTASVCFINKLKEKIDKENIHIPLVVLGPSRCTYEKLNGRYRYRIIIKCKNNTVFRSFIGDIYKNCSKLREFANVRAYIDINGDISI